MTDTAQLREALDATERLVTEHEWPQAILSEPITAAARELLTLREAGALIIVPDEDGHWPGWAIRAFGKWWRTGRLVAATPLDALRDAMPDGET